MSSTLHTIPFNPQPRTDEGDSDPCWVRERRQDMIRSYLNSGIDKASDGAQTRMRYAPRCYASDIVIKGGQKIVGWPSMIPFTDLANIRGGSLMLAELHRRCLLPDWHPDKLRFEPTSHEDQVNAARDPESIHPTPHLLPALKVKAAEAAAARVAARTRAAARARYYHPRNMQYVGRPSTSKSKIQRGQRRDTKKRRARASDADPRVRRKRPRRGITSMPFVLPGSDGTSGGSGGEPASKREEVEEYALDDDITQFDLSPEFDSELTDPDPIESTSRLGSEEEVD
ncbi:uncharacterized protein TRAVEDRAFT_46780 [Trametes versicolor FP-101664 SS1]|uniref:uncharacterized protein n=1 Tax=Trametes versicolor (strain FP-101664) TaxID=717944 RepID=UPI0004622A54|nr:uncharacterized protein TRAVEDRAFT_46780 [Trametes versicolor FP-101664 SS1]EIW59473.1 hypothetical protein TRAVEDRAFT_46780 [Trametes versicolor FP-101664 SS1]